MDRTYYEKCFIDMLPDAESKIFKEIDKYIEDEFPPLQKFYDILVKIGINWFDSISLSEGNEQASTPLNMIYQGYYYWKNEKKTYKISDNIVNALIATDPDSVSVNAVIPPHDSMYFTFSNKYFTLLDPKTGIHKVEGMFLTQFEDNEYKHWRVMIIASENENSRAEYGGYDDTIFFYRIKIKKGQKLKGSFEMEGENITEISEMEQVYQEQMISTFRFLCNVILYLSTGKIPAQPIKEEIPPCITKKPKKIKRWQKEYGNLTKMKYYNIEDKDLTDIYENQEPGGNTLRERMHWKSAWLVIGHFHSYWVGKGRTHIQVNWLQPYWKGENKLEMA